MTVVRQGGRAIVAASHAATLRERPIPPLAAVPVVLLLLGPLTCCVPWLARITDPAQVGLLVLDLILLGGSLAIGVARGLRPMLTLSAVFVLLWIGLPAVFQISHGLAAWHDDAVVQLRGTTLEALGLVGAAQGALLVGYWFARARPREHPLDLAAPRPGRTDLIVAGVLVMLALVALPVVTQVLGGFQVLFASRSSITNAAADVGIDLEQSGGVGIALLRVVPMSLAVAGTLLAAQQLIRGRSGRGRAVTWVVAAVGAALTVAYANPLANSRFTALSALGSIALIAWRPRRSSAGVLVVAGFAAFMLLAYPLANVFRGDGASTLDDLQPAGGAFAFLASRDFDGFQQIANSFLFVAARGHSDGHYLLSAILVFLPRSVWPDKATPASLDVAAARGYSFTDLSLPTNAEIYIDFGWVGVVVVFLLVGAVYARLDTAWLSGDGVVALVAFGAVAQIGIIRGPLGSIAPVIDLTLLVLVGDVALRARAHRRPPPNRAGGI